MSTEALDSKALAEAHWGYIRELLAAHEEDQHVIDVVEFHYKSAFVHGYKHAVEDMQDDK